MTGLLNYKDLNRLIELQLQAFPEHKDYIEKRFKDADHSDLEVSDELAAKIMQIAGNDLGVFCDDYKWLSGIVLEEELFFRRNGKYRLDTFEQAYEQVYSNRPYMTRYMNALLLSQVWWGNHTLVHKYYCDEFIGKNPKGFRHLEVGPGHGLFLYHALASANCASVTAWDVSLASLNNTAEALTAMGVSNLPVLEEVNIFDASPTGSFSSITFSEVLEHLEQPRLALEKLYGLLEKGGRIFINAPVNSPAPDHLYLFNTPEEIVDMVQSVGFKVEGQLFAPSMGVKLERARKFKLAISTAVIATK